MSRSTWSRSGKPRVSTPTGARPEGSLALSVERARQLWDGLTGGPTPMVVDMGLCDCGAAPQPVKLGWEYKVDHDRNCAGIRSTGRYSDAAAAAILDTALRLWPDTAASMSEGDGDG